VRERVLELDWGLGIAVAVIVTIITCLVMKRKTEREMREYDTVPAADL
jgi:hypothetical protein